MKLRVMMLAYKHEPFIRQALESVLAQRVNFDYEIVVGEDRSTDATCAILMDFYRRYPERIVLLLHDRNIGMMRNFQGTLAACQGQYLAIIEGDDYWTCADKLHRDRSISSISIPTVGFVFIARKFLIKSERVGRMYSRF